MASISAMDLQLAAGWGLLGGVAGSLAFLTTDVMAAGFQWPWRNGGEIGPRLFVLTAWLALGAIVAAAAHGQMTGGWPAFLMGLGAPATVRGILSGVAVEESNKKEAPEAAESVAGGDVA